MAAERVAPDELIVQTNLSGSITDIDDDPDSPDGNWLTAIDNVADTVCRVGFATPVATPLPGEIQEFKIQVRKSPASGNRHPSVSAELYENDVFIDVVLSATDVTNATSQIIAMSWDMNRVGVFGDGVHDETGAEIEIRIFGAAVSAGPSSQRRTVEVGAVEWNAETGVNEGFTD